MNNRERQEKRKEKNQQKKTRTSHRFPFPEGTSIIEKYFHLVVKSPHKHECWKWEGSKKVIGDPRIWHEGKYHIASRVAWEAHNGIPTPKHLEVQHDCDNRECTNPQHLRLGNHVGNMNDVAQRGLIKRKLTLEQRLEAARRVIIGGESQKAVARSFGVNNRCIGYHASSRRARELIGPYTPQPHYKPSAKKRNEDKSKP